MSFWRRDREPDPRLEELDRAIARIGAASEPPNKRRQLILVLLVEDNPGDIDLALDVLNPTSLFDVVIAHTLAEFMKRLQASEPDVILLDLHLPDSTGDETIETVVEAAPDIPVVVRTGLTEGELAVRALRLGAESFVPKGLGDDGNTLLRAIRNALKYHPKRHLIEGTT